MDLYSKLHSFASLFEAFDKQAQLVPAKTALQEAGKTFSYAQLAGAIAHLQTRFREQGCTPQEKVAWAVLEGSSFIALAYAVTGLEAVAVPLDPHASVEEWQRCCVSCDVTTMVVSTALAPKAQQLFKQNQQIRQISTIAWQETTPVLQRLAVRPAMVCIGESRPGDAFILCTSGTTGKPKGVILTHSNFLTNQEAVRSLLHLSSTDTLLILKPLFHSSTIMEMLLQLQIGGELVFAPRFFPHALPAWIKQTHCTMLCLVPTMLKEFLAELQQKQLLITDHLTISVVAGALDATLVAELTRFMGAAAVFHGYGLTEASPRVSMLLPTEWNSHSGSVGKALPGVELAIWNEHNQELAPGVIGEVVVRGPNVMRGYYKDATLTNQVLQNGWLCTKDLGWLDEQGYLYITGRKDDQINCGGQKIMPQEIEYVLQCHPLVHEAVVCPAADARLGQIPIAFLVRQSTTLRSQAPLPNDESRLIERDCEGVEDLEKITHQLLEHCRHHLAPFKIPRRVYWITRLPKTASGKVRRQLLSAFDEKEEYGFQPASE